MRELGRLKRDSEAREVLEREKADIERRRNMTEEERIEEDRRLGLGQFQEKEKRQWKFMQKYYHKGAFFMDADSLSKADENDVRKRKYDGATGEDQFDFEKLPSVLQVKNFGKKGRTKYTHLVDQDTSRIDGGLRIDRTVEEKMRSKLGGVGLIDRDRDRDRQKKRAALSFEE